MNIALAIILDPVRSRTLIARRPDGVHLEHRWEFPGGKMEPEETAAECAIREAREETHLEASIVEAWTPVTFSYPERLVTLHPFLCEAGTERPALNRWEWITIEDLDKYPFPEANFPLIARLQTEFGPEKR